MRYFIRLIYDGTRFHGWQRQLNHNSIQQMLEDGMATILRRSTPVHGCGRTDGGVHANDYFAHIDLHDDESSDRIVYRINKLLPPDILVKTMIPVTGTANAQKDAISRTYHYYVHTEKDPFQSEYSTWLPDLQLDLSMLNEISRRLLSTKDFAAFCKTPLKHKSTQCHIIDANWAEVAKNKFRFEISADHFLRGMIRLLVGNMLEVASGKIHLSEFQEYLQLTKTPTYFRLAPPQGLHLVQIIYPDHIFSDYIPQQTTWT